MLVEAQVSSMKTSWAGFLLGCRSRQTARGRNVRPVLLCGVERLFFKRQPARFEKPVDRRAANPDALLRQCVTELLERHVRTRPDQRADHRLMRGKPMVVPSAHLARLNRTRLPPPLHQLESHLSQPAFAANRIK
jgi:hypothetical protein